MKKISIILLMLISVSAFAQQNRQGERMNRAEGSVEERATQMAERMAERLDLNESQQEKLQIVFEEQAEEWQSLMAERRERRQETREARREMRAERREAFAKRQQAFEERMKTILNEEQFNKWKELASERRGPRSNRTENDS